MAYNISLSLFVHNSSNLWMKFFDSKYTIPLQTCLEGEGGERGEGRGMVDRVKGSEDRAVHK